MNTTTKKLCTDVELEAGIREEVVPQLNLLLERDGNTLLIGSAQSSTE
jgi:hypothetical protein